jgi:hypothetical protein
VTTRYPARDCVMFLLSMKAGLRAKEMAVLTWAMVTDASGQVAEVLHVPNRCDAQLFCVGVTLPALYPPSCQQCLSLVSSCHTLQRGSPRLPMTQGLGAP